MAALKRPVGDRLVLSPQEPLVAGGAAENFEQNIRELYRKGYRHLVADLSGVASIDSAGVRALVWMGLRWPLELTGVGDVADELISGGRKSGVPAHHFQPFIELLKLVVAALIGMFITAIHQPTMRERTPSMEQAQTLLCVSGAMMMIIIGNSLARAFGIAGAAGIIKFRTPVDDTKDATILFLLMGLGMSTGLGAFAVAGLGTAFLCIALLALDRVS